MLYLYNIKNIAVMEKYLIHSNELHLIDAEKIHQAVEKMVESLDMLRADRQTDSARINFLFCKFLRVELRMSGTCRMNDQ